MCCDSGSVRNRNKPGYMRGTPSILEYRETRSQSRGADNPQGRPVDETGTLRDCTPGSDAQASDDDTVHAPWRHGEHVNKVSVGEPADGSPPKERHQQFGGLGKVERASAPDRERLIHSFFGFSVMLSVCSPLRWVQYRGALRELSGVTQRCPVELSQVILAGSDA